VRGRRFARLGVKLALRRRLALRRGLARLVFPIVRGGRAVVDSIAAAAVLRRLTGVVGRRGITGTRRRLPFAHAATTAATASAAPAASPARATLGTVTARLARGRCGSCIAGSFRPRCLITRRGFARRAAVSLARRPAITLARRPAITLARRPAITATARLAVSFA